MKLTELNRLLEDDITEKRFGSPGDRFPTVNDIALLYGVSLQTASRSVKALAEKGLLTLSGKRYYLTYGCASPATPYGAILKSRALPILGLDLNKIDNPFFSSLAEKFTEKARQHGYSLIIQSNGNSKADKLENLKLFKSLNVSGIFAVPEIGADNFEVYRSCPLPLVLLGRSADLPSCDVVIVENEISGNMVAKHLVSVGCVSFAYLGLTRFLDLDSRLSGFRSGLRGLGRSLDVLISADSASDVTLRPQVLQLVHDAPKPLGLFCYHDLLAAEALRAIKSGGSGRYVIPDDVCIVGFDDLPITTIVNPPLTTISYRYDRIVDSAMSMMLDHINNPAHRPSSVTVSAALTIRQSTMRSETITNSAPSPDRFAYY